MQDETNPALQEIVKDLLNINHWSDQAGFFSCTHESGNIPTAD